MTQVLYENNIDHVWLDFMTITNKDEMWLKFSQKISNLTVKVASTTEKLKELGIYSALCFSEARTRQFEIF